MFCRELGESSDTEKAPRHKCPTHMATAKDMLSALRQANFDCTEIISGHSQPVTYMVND